MMKQVARVSVRVVLASLVLLAGAAFYLLAANTAMANNSNLVSALPSLAELPNFGSLLKGPAATGEASIAAKRKSDGMFLMVWVFTKASEAEAQQLVAQATTSSQVSRMPEGSPSGRLIGQEVRQSQRPGEVRGGYQLITRDGRSVVVIRVTVPVTGRGANGKAIHGTISPADLAFFEGLAIGRLNKLAKMGYTSGRPVVRAQKATRRDRKR